MPATPKMNPREIILVPIRADALIVYEAATRLLKRQLGSDTPDTMMLVNHELSNRDARGIADDYLDCYDHDRERLVFSIQMQSGPKKRIPMSKDLRTAKIVAKIGRRKTAVNESWLTRRALPFCRKFPMPADPSRN